MTLYELRIDKRYEIEAENEVTAIERTADIIKADAFVIAVTAELKVKEE